MTPLRILRGRSLTGRLAAVATLLGACAGSSRAARGPSATSDAPTFDLALMTFNIRFDNPEDGINVWTNRRALVADAIRTAAPDVVGLQEARRNQLDDIESALRASEHWGEIGVGRDDGARGGEYSPLLYREDRVVPLESGTFWLSPTTDVPGSTGWGNHVPRICTWARFRLRANGHTFYAFNTHFDHESPDARARAAELLAARVAARPHRDPCFVMGDFNAVQTDAPIAYLEGRAPRASEGREAVTPSPGFVDTFEVFSPGVDDVTFNGWGSEHARKIDYIFAAPAPLTRVLDARIVRTLPDGHYPSDHFPVTAHLRVVAR